MNACLKAIPIFLLAATAIRAESPSGIAFDTPSQFSTISSKDENGGEPLVGQLGDPASIVFAGLEQLTADQVHSALALDLIYQAAARPSAPLGELLSVLEDRLVAGLQHSGFMDATVATSYNAQTNAIHVSISEGVQFTNGSIQITGAEKIDVSSIAQQLAQAGKTRPWTYFFGENRAGEYANASVANATWRKGEVTDCGEEAIAQLTMRIRHLMVEQGFPFTAFTVAVEPETADTAALVVRISKEGVPGAVDAFKVTGLTRHSEQQLLSYLGLSRGSAINAQVLDDIHAKLRDSCRFWGHKLWVRVPTVGDDRYGGSPKGLELAITLTEYEHVPPLDEPLSAEEESMKRFAHWLERHGVEQISESGDLVIQSRSPSDGAGIDFRCVISPQQGILLNLDCEIGGLYTLHHSAIVAPGRMELVNWSRKTKTTVNSDSINTALNIQWTPGNVENGEYRSRIVLGSAIIPKENSDKAKAWSITCEPVAAVHLLHRNDAKYERVNGELRVRSADTELCIEEASGRLQHMSLKNFDRQNLSANIGFQPSAFADVMQDVQDRSRACVECYDIDEPVLSLAHFAVDELREQPFVRQSQLRQLALSAIKGCLNRDSVEKLASLRSAGNENQSPVDFDIPAVNLNLEGDWNKCLAFVMKLLPAAADKLFPRGSWPWTYTREAVFGYVSTMSQSFFERNAGGFKPEIQRAFDIPESGPLASLMPLLLFRAFLPEEARKVLAYRGSQKLEVESLANDVRLLSYNETLCNQFVTRFLVEVDHLNAEQREALREELAPHMGNLLDMLVERHKNHPDEPGTRALEAVILEAWPAGLSDALADFLVRSGR